MGNYNEKGMGEKLDITAIIQYNIIVKSKIPI